MKTEIAPGPVAHWTFDELSPDRTEVPDAAGHGRAGRIHGQVLVPGVVNQAVCFEGFPEQQIDSPSGEP